MYSGQEFAGRAELGLGQGGLGFLRAEGCGLEMLSSLLFSSSSLAELFRIELGSGRAVKFELRVGLGRTIKRELRSGFASLMYCRIRQVQKSQNSFIFFLFDLILLSSRNKT